MIIEENQNWREPTEERCYYIDLEFTGRIYVTKEMYNEYMKSTWSKWKRNERSTRCQVSNGRGGVKRCDKDCKEWPHFRSGKSVSLDEVYEKYELEISDKSSSIIEKMVEEERNAALWKAVEELDPLDQKIMKLLSEGFSERDMAEALGIPQRIWVTEEFYKTYKRNFWNEWKEKLLVSGCRIKSEKGNFWKRCDGDCSICPHSKTGNTLSLDRFFADTELEFPDESVDIVRDTCIEERERMPAKEKKLNINKKTKIIIKRIINFISTTIGILDFFGWIIKLIQFIIKHWF